MNIVIVIPTYNEKENIQKLIPAIDKSIINSKLTYKVLIVDGNSPDGTYQEVINLSKDYKFVHAIKEQKKAGLGSAYLFGFNYALNKLNADIVVEMDADFQHDPKYLNTLVAPIVNNQSDYVIGSRFTKGGSIPKEWALYRKILSVGGNLISKIVLGIYNLNDFTSGFKASRVKGFVDKINFDQVSSKGFAYKMDLLYKMHKLKARITEIPIEFGVRDRGDSKMEKSNAMDSLKVVFMLRIKDNKSFFKFVIVGFIGLFVDAGLFNIFRFLAVISAYNSAIVSGLIAMITTFLFNNFWSFGERKLKITFGKFMGFVFYLLLGLILHYTLYISNANVVLISTPITVLLIVILDRLTKYKIMNFSNYIVGISNLLIYFMFSFFPIVVRSNIVNLFVTNFGDTFILTNLAFFIGIAFGLIWNFTIYNKIIWKKKKIK